MRFLIDTTTIQFTQHGKFARVIKILASQTRAQEVSPVFVELVSSEIYSVQDAKFDVVPFWIKMPWKWPQRLEDAQRVLKVLLGIAKAYFLRKRLRREHWTDITWSFAKTFDFFPSSLRSRIAETTAIEFTPQGRELFLHWISERGPAYQMSATPTTKHPILPSKGDILILAGSCFGYVDMDALSALRAARGFKIVCFIYDLLPLDYPSILPVRDFVKYKNFVISASKKADLIVVPNRTTLGRLERFIASIGICAEQRIVQHSMIEAALQKIPGKLSARLREFEIDKRRFILCVSGLMPRKHVLWVYALCARLQNERENFPLLVIAGSSVNSHIFGILEKDHAWGKAGVFVMNPTDGELAWLYKHTLLTLHPSFEGGLGLSVTEAIHFGRPCIAADAPSLIEASGGLAEHLPRDETLWAEAICRILDQEPRHRSPCPQQEMTDKSIVARLIEEFGPP